VSRVLQGVPSWLTQVALCPEDGGPLAVDADTVVCATCGRAYTEDGGTLLLLPDRLREQRTGDASVRWIADELQWWDPWHDRQPRRPYSPHAGLRGRSRERNLLAPVRDRLPAQPLVIEMGAGDSRTVAGLWPPSAGRLRYVATDMSLPALHAGRAMLGPEAASVRCDAVTWPFGEAVADVVLILGVLHHLSDWRQALERACRTVKPGGFVLLHEAVSKPRVLARLRERGVDDHWVSPHEGDVPAAELRAELERHGTVEHWYGEQSPLGFGLVRYGIERLGWYDRLESSPALAAGLSGLDQAFGRTLGRLFPSLGFNEISAVWRRADAFDPVAFYEDAYRTEGVAERERLGRWRALGARIKVDHVLRLWQRADLRPAAVAELGCGDGSVLEGLSRRARPERLDGFDLSLPAVEIARRRALPGVRVEVFDGEHLPAGDDAYDVAILSHVVEHVVEPVPLLREAARLAPWVVVEVPLEDNRSGARPHNREQSASIGHVLCLDRARVHALLDEAGLDVREELSDPLPFSHVAFFADGRLARAKGAVKTVLRRAVWRVSPRLAERWFTVHYACLAHRRSGTDGVISSS
jgi:ubiquinone/menaquinone biosynthesis C-methylase UbiE/uncharacterized protein YbaR (Trm112 family)